MIRTWVDSYCAEWMKLRRMPVAWISGLSGVLIAGFLFFVFVFKGDMGSNVPSNPWDGFFALSITVFGMLIGPFIILVTHGVVHLEHQTSSWKSLYTLPFDRAAIFFPKSAVILTLVLSIYVVFGLSILLSGLLLGIVVPSFGFLKYVPEFSFLFNRLAHLFFAGVGMIGLQYWISLRWDNYLVPISIGFIGYLASMFTVGKSDFAFIIPYCYPVFISLGLGSGDIGRIGLEWWGALTNIEGYSFLAFLLFLATGYHQESRKEIR